MPKVFDQVHIPTLGVAIVAVLVLLLAYHMFARR